MAAMPHWYEGFHRIRKRTARRPLFSFIEYVRPSSVKKMAIWPTLSTGIRFLNLFWINGDRMTAPKPAQPKTYVAVLASTFLSSGIETFITVKMRLQYMFITFTVDI